MQSFLHECRFPLEPSSVVIFASVAKTRFTVFKMINGLRRTKGIPHENRSDKTVKYFIYFGLPQLDRQTTLYCFLNTK